VAIENFTGYDETDEGDNVTRIASKVSWDDLDRDESSHVSDSKGAGHFSGDFEHKFECLWENHVGYGLVFYWALANVQEDWKTIDNASGDAQGFAFENENLGIYTLENGGVDSDVYETPAESTLHYITVARDDDGGANGTGQITVEIHEGDYHPAGTHKDLLTIDCGAGEQNDFEFVFGLMSFDDGTPNNTVDGYTQNLDLQEGAPPAGHPYYYREFANRRVA
jgi:hypothetical protein